MKELKIGEKIIECRRQQGITQDDLAQYMGVSKASVSKWETSTSYVSYTVDENGALHSWNISAYQIPELCITEEIAGTVYTVTGSFEGTQNLLRKLERISAKQMAEEWEAQA